MAAGSIWIKQYKKGERRELGPGIDPSAPGFVLRDTRGYEHHFGGPERGVDGVVFSYVASYAPEAGRVDEYDLWDELAKGRKLVEPTLGPKLTKLTRAAVDQVIKDCARKGFAFPLEKQIAVNALQALMEVNEPFPPAELEVYSATHGFSPERAAAFRDLAERVIEGRSFRPAIKLDSGQGDRLRDYWRKRWGG